MHSVNACVVESEASMTYIILYYIITYIQHYSYDKSVIISLKADWQRTN